MSVPVGDRGEGQLQVLNKARELRNYSLQMVKNEKIFPRSTRWIYAQAIVDCVRDISLNIRQANSVMVLTQEDYAERRLRQLKAHENVDALYELIQDAYEAQYLSGERSAHWTKLVQEVDVKLKSWINSDKERYYKH